jgi:hypothetical protein
MARGDGKAIRGKTKSFGSEKPRYTKSGVRKMAYGGNPGDLAGGGFGTGNTGLSSSGSSPSSDNGFRDSSSVGSYGGSSQGGGGGYSTGSSSGSGGSGQGQTGYRSSTSAAISAGSSGGSGSTSARISGVSAGSIASSSRAGTSAANISAGRNPGDIASGGYGTGNIGSSSLSSAAIRSATQAASASSPTGLRGTAGSYQPSSVQVSPVAGYGAGYSGAIDARTVMPGNVSFNQVPATVPFAESILGKKMLAKSANVMSYPEAISLQAQLPRGRYVRSYTEAEIDPTQYDTYGIRVANPFTGRPVSGYVGIQKGTTGMGMRNVGQWNPSTDSATPTSDFRGLPNPNQSTATRNYSSGYQSASEAGPSMTSASDYRVGPIAEFTSRSSVPIGTPGLFSPKSITGRLTQEEIDNSIPAIDVADVGPRFNMLGRPSTPVTAGGTPYSDVFGSTSKIINDRLADEPPEPGPITPAGARILTGSVRGGTPQGYVTASQPSQSQATLSSDSPGFWEGLAQTVFGTAPTTQQSTSVARSTGVTTPAYNPTSVRLTTDIPASSTRSSIQRSSNPGFNTYGAGSYPTPESAPARSPLNTSNVVAAAAGAYPTRGDGGQDDYLLRRRRSLLAQQAADDQMTSGTSAMRNGGRANGLAQRGWTKGKFR